MAMDNKPVKEAFYALVYNPYGERKDYAWPFPKRWFDIDNDKSLLIGEELWDFLGGKRHLQTVHIRNQQIRGKIQRDHLQGISQHQSGKLSDRDERLFTEMKHDKFTFIDLFAGIGGFRLALWSRQAADA